MTTPPSSSSPLSRLRCPRCRGDLEAAGAGPADGPRQLRCCICGMGYPVLAGIPLLMERPEEWLKRWEEGLGHFVQQMAFSEKQLLIDLLEHELSDRGRHRVQQVLDGLTRHRDEVIALLARIGVEAPETSSSQVGAGTFSPETYLTLIHRDYGWAPDVDEVEVSWQRLVRVLPAEFRPKSTLVLGAGTGRLAWQLAAELGDGSPVLALDINPLPFIVTAELLAGRQPILTELPAHPRRSTAATMTRALRCRHAASPQLGLVFADGLKPPVEGPFDTIVTPWFVDQVPDDASTIPLLANSLLREGGSFICTGPFLYDAGHTKPALRYCADEFIEHVERAGFVVTAASYEPEPYVASPLSTQGRIEHVLYLHARKVAPVSARPPLPPYLKPGLGASLPIPQPEALATTQFSHEIVGQVATLIDGKRSVLQMTEILLRRGALADDGTADVAVRSCLKLIFKQLDASGESR